MAATDDLTRADRAPDASPRRDPGVTLRVIVLVLILAPLNAYFMAFLHGRQIEDPTVVSLFWNVLFALVVLRLLNAILLRFGPRRAFTPAELLCFFILLSVATSQSGQDTFMTTWGTMQGASVFSDPQNHWAALFGRYLPQGMLVNDPGALDRLWKGGTSFFQADNLRVWIGPILRWWLFYLALWTAPIGLAVILRRRWIDSERMGFPIVQVPMDISRPTIVPLGRWTFWIGFGLPVMINILNGFHVFYPGVPQIPVKIYQTPVLNVHTYLVGRPWNALGMFYLCFYPFIIGLGLLLPADLSLSLWVFFLFWKVEAVFCAQMGWNQTPEFPYMKDQSFGGYLALLFLALWTARSHLAQVWAAILGRRGYDDNEPLRYRTALFIFVAGFLYVVAVGISQKLAIWVSIYFFAQYYMMTLIVGRIRAEMGMPTHELERLGPTVTLGNVLGARTLGEQQLTSLSVFFSFTRGMRNIPFPLQLESLYLADRFKLDGRRLLLASILMIGVGQAFAWIMSLSLGYQHGLSSPWGGNWMLWGSQEAWRQLAGWLNYSRGVHWGRLEAIGLGFGVYWLMMMARMRWIGFPLHPMGFALGTTWYMTHMSGPMLVAWAIKSVSTRYLGPKTMPDVRALAFGLILGDVISGAVWILYGLFAHVVTYSFWP